MKLLGWLGVLLSALILPGLYSLCRPCICIGSVMRCIGNTVEEFPILTDDQARRIEILVVKSTYLRDLEVGELRNLKEFHFRKNIWIPCELLSDFQKSYPEVKVVTKECLEVIMKTEQRTILHTSTSTTTTATTHIQPSKKTKDAALQPKDQNSTPEVVELEFTTPSGMKIAVKMTNYSAVINATVSFEYGDYKLQFVTGSVVVVVLVLTFVGAVLCYKLVIRKSDVGVNWRYGRMDLSSKPIYSGLDENSTNQNTPTTTHGNAEVINLVDVPPPDPLPAQLQIPLQEEETIFQAPSRSRPAKKSSHSYSLRPRSKKTM